jgi:hypothetical protein
LVLSALSLTIRSSWFQTASQGGVSSGSFSAAARPRGKPRLKSRPSRVRSLRLARSSRRPAIKVSAAARVGGLCDSNAMRKRTSRFSTPTQMESEPVVGFEAALQSTMT